MWSSAGRQRSAGNELSVRWVPELGQSRKIPLPVRWRPLLISTRPGWFVRCSKPQGIRDGRQEFQAAAKLNASVLKIDGISRTFEPRRRNGRKDRARINPWDLFVKLSTKTNLAILPMSWMDHAKCNFRNNKHQNWKRQKIEVPKVSWRAVGKNSKRPKVVLTQQTFQPTAIRNRRNGRYEWQQLSEVAHHKSIRPARRRGNQTHRIHRGRVTGSKDLTWWEESEKTRALHKKVWCHWLYIVLFNFSCTWTGWCYCTANVAPIL